jgi:putative FmdB family regulatory protein
MPVYDYVCSACGRVTEVIHGIHAAGPRFCPACGAEGTLRKGIQTPAVHFRGSGWAKKDRASASATRASGRGSGTDRKVESGPGAAPSDGGPAPTTADGKGSRDSTPAAGSGGDDHRHSPAPKAGTTSGDD